MNQLTNLKSLNLGAGIIRKENMPNSLSYMLTCTRTIKDETTQLFTYVDIFDAIYIPASSGFWIQTFCIVGKLYIAEEGTIKVETSFIYPDGTRSLPSTIEGKVHVGYLQFNTIFNSIKFTQLGKYYLKLKIGEEELEKENRFYFDVMSI